MKLSTVSLAETDSGVREALHELRDLGYDECLKGVANIGGFDKVLIGVWCLKGFYTRDTNRTVSNVLSVKLHLSYDEFVDAAPQYRLSLVARYLNDAVRRGVSELLALTGQDPTAILSAHRHFLRSHRLV